MYCVWKQFGIVHGGENDINRFDRHKDPLKHMGYVDAAQRQRKFAKAELFFSGFLVEHSVPFEYCKLCC